MKKVILLFFVLFVGVAGFANGGNGELVFEKLEVVEFNGGIDLSQGVIEIEVVIYDNENNSASATVLDSNGKRVFHEFFIGNGSVMVNKSNLDKGTYTLIVYAGSNTRSLIFTIN